MTTNLAGNAQRFLIFAANVARCTLNAVRCTLQRFIDFQFDFDFVCDSDCHCHCHCYCDRDCTSDSDSDFVVQCIVVPSPFLVKLCGMN